MKIQLLTFIASALAAFPEKDVVDTIYNVVNTDKLDSYKGTSGGVWHGEEFNTPQEKPFGTYNYCFMPHPNINNYQKVEGAELVYVHYVQRHQKRTAYNIFPAGEDTDYKCDQIMPFQYESSGKHGAHVYQDYYSSNHNPFLKTSANGTCQFPQLTVGGFNDGRQHGKDLYKLYGENFGLLPKHGPDDTVFLRSSSSHLTQQTASGVLSGVWPQYDGPIALKQQSPLVDTVDAKFPCDKRDKLKKLLTTHSQWKEHLDKIQPLVDKLDSIAGTVNDKEWHENMDHFNDNLQARQCNGYDLPKGVSQDQANQIYTAGDWEWNYYWVDQPNSTEYIQATEGLFIGEIIDDIQKASKKDSKVKYSHIFIHDGDIGPLAGALGIKKLRWPGMGSNLAFELWDKHGDKYVRVLYCGAPIRSNQGFDWIKLDEFARKMGKYVPKDMVEFCK